MQADCIAGVTEIFRKNHQSKRFNCDAEESR